jgi:predicted metal-binding membrane protein
LRRDRFVILAALCSLIALACAYLVFLAPMENMPMDQDAMDSMGQSPWNAGYFAAMFIMWTVMMVGMMVPSAAPMILLYAALERNRDSSARTYRSTALFVAGYLVIWTAFSLVATAAEWGLSEAALLSPMLGSTTPVLGGVLFILAGVYQLTPLKNACLSKCRAPARFLAEHRRDGPLGPFLLGVEHGAYCIGCCWVLMALLFAVGVMNLFWVAGIAVFVLVEKLLPAGPLIGRIGAALMLGVGVILLVVR